MDDEKEDPIAPARALLCGLAIAAIFWILFCLVLLITYTSINGSGT